ncbi:hypothetical protein TNCV_4340041 [Trichonephila clavipes]|nr:hypothetical protein TNCV_4340041 [Trichonephila clavipes]
MCLYFLHTFHIRLNICHNVLRASVCLSRRRLPPVRITSLELLLSPRRLCRSAYHRETLLGSGIKKITRSQVWTVRWVINLFPSKDLIRFCVLMAEWGLCSSVAAWEPNGHTICEISTFGNDFVQSCSTHIRTFNAKVEIVNSRPLRIFSSTALTKSSVITDGRPERGSTLTFSRPPLNALTTYYFAATHRIWAIHVAYLSVNFRC